MKDAVYSIFAGMRRYSIREVAGLGCVGVVYCRPYTWLLCVRRSFTHSLSVKLDASPGMPTRRYFALLVAVVYFLC